MGRLSVRRSLIVALPLLAAALAGWGGSSTTSSARGAAARDPATGTITFMAADYSSLTTPYWQHLIARFEKANPGAKVNLQVVSWNDIEQKITTLVATGQQPDLLNLDHYANFAADGLLMPASKFVSPHLRADLVPRLAENAVIHGVQWAVPLGASVRGMFYNKDIFRQAGIASPPKTWAELLADALKIKTKTGKVGYGMPMGPEEPQAEFSLLAFGNGGGWKKNGKWAINQPANVQALNFMVQLADKYRVTEPNPGTVSSDPIFRVFEAGQVGMTECGNFCTALIKQTNPKLKYGIGPVPVNGSNPAVTLSVEDYLMAFKTTKYPAVVEKFLDFFYRPDNYGRFMSNEGFLGATKSLTKIMERTTPFQRPFIAAIKHAEFYPTTDPTWGAVEGRVQNGLGAAFAGTPVKTVLDDLQRAALRGGR